MAPAGDHDYRVRATSTATFGRVILNARGHHVVVDGPEQTGCRGEAITPAELFLGGVAACGAELVQVIARDKGIGLDGVEAEMAGTVDRAHEVRSDVTVFSALTLRFLLRGVGDDDGAALVAAFKGR